MSLFSRIVLWLVLQLGQKLGYPQGELKVSRISEAISGANGEYSHQLLAPADNISIAKNELAVLGTISWT